MRAGVVWWVTSVLVACGGGLPVLPTEDAAATNDASQDAPPDVSDASTKPCDLAKPFGAPTPLVGQNLATGYEYAPALSADELTLWFTSGRAEDASTNTFVHIYVATRPSLTSPFSDPVYANVNSLGNESDPWLSNDGLTLYFESDRDTGGNDVGNIFVATRANTQSDFGTPTSVLAVNSDIDDDIYPALDADGSLWFASNRPGGQGMQDLWRAQLSGGTFDAPVDTAGLDSPQDDWSPTPSADGHTLYFASTRPGGAGKNDIWVATRTDTSQPFSTPTNVSELNTSNDDLPHWLSTDGCRLYLDQQQGTGYVLTVAVKPK